MNSETIVYCVVALILGMLLANMLKNVCGCKNVVEGSSDCSCPWGQTCEDGDKCKWIGGSYTSTSCGHTCGAANKAAYRLKRCTHARADGDADSIMTYC